MRAFDKRRPAAVTRSERVLSLSSASSPVIQNDEQVKDVDHAVVVEVCRAAPLFRAGTPGVQQNQKIEDIDESIPVQIARNERRDAALTLLVGRLHTQGVPLDLAAEGVGGADRSTAGGIGASGRTVRLSFAT